MDPASFNCGNLGQVVSLFPVGSLSQPLFLTTTVIFTLQLSSSCCFSAPLPSYPFLLQWWNHPQSPSTDPISHCSLHSGHLVHRVAFIVEVSLCASCWRDHALLCAGQAVDLLKMLSQDNDHYSTAGLMIKYSQAAKNW